MERKFTDENFENFLQQNADGLRMRPSEKVWKEISKRLHRRRRRFFIPFGSALLAICTFGYLALDNGSQESRNHGTQAETANASATASPAQAAPSAGGAKVVDIASHLSATGTAPADIATTGTGLQGSAPVIAMNTITTNALSAAAEPATEAAELLYDEYQPPTGREEKPAIKEAAPSLFPQTIESVTNFRPKTKKKLAFEFYFTPTVSYRKLYENKSFLRNQNVNSTNPAAWGDVNNMVTHRPDLGFELGLAGRLPLTRRMNLRTGLQLNINRYSIHAYSTSTAVTTIVLNTRNNGVDSIPALTRHSNVNGDQSEWLENFYFQVSAPVGLEFILAQGARTRFGIATTIQPTYVLGERSYLITPDYKSYTKADDLIRRWNVNTGLEAFIGYSTGKLNWQVGPQFRYQLLSSFDSEYPVKEHLFNYGLRIGISLNNNQ